MTQRPVMLCCMTQRPVTLCPMTQRPVTQRPVTQRDQRLLFWCRILAWVFCD